MDIQEKSASDEWRIIESLLPPGWEEEARRLTAFRRARYLKEPGVVLRLLLFHAVNGRGMRNTVAQAKAAGVASISAVALFKRLQTAGPWLRWLALELCRPLRERPNVPGGLRPRAIDGTTIQGPANTTSDWRLHYTLDLITMGCDWHELTDARSAEGLERTAVSAGDVILGDRNYFRVKGIRAVTKAGGHVLLRLRWNHPRLEDKRGKSCSALSLARRLRVGQIGDWPVRLPGGEGKPIEGRIVAVKLPRPVAKEARERAKRKAAKQQREINPNTLEAANYVMLFTTLPAKLLNAAGVADLYRYRWQIEIAFKRHKQLLQLGHLPHQDPAAAESWILSKLVVALLLETLYRRAIAFSPWGHDTEAFIPAG
jgi:hypothetical protein